MLCKTSDNISLITQSTENSSYNYYQKGTQLVDPRTLTALYDGHVTINFTCSVKDTGLNTNVNVAVNIKDATTGQVLFNQSRANNGATIAVSREGDIVKDHIIQLVYISNNGSISSVTVNRTTAISITYQVEKKGGPAEIKLYPDKVVGIGNTTNMILYGTYSSQRVFIGGIVTGKTSTATTGSITLGNAKGYVTINYNGEILKIPYFGY